MLDPWIIEEIRRREEEERRIRHEDRPVADMPLEAPPYPPEHEGRPEEGTQRGVIIVELGLG